MLDQFGRTIEYARLSLTSRCNLRCLYCNPGNGCIEASDQPLDADAFDKIVSALCLLGIKKVRLTGGEPLLRDDILDIVKRVSGHRELEDISMTTNGMLLAQKAQALKAAGLQRVNVSLDSLNDAMYQRLSGGGSVSAVIDGIRAALSCGLTPVRLNVVLVKGLNDNDLDAFMDIARLYPLDVRFIELMPDGTGSLESDKLVITQDEILKRYPDFEKHEIQEKGQPAVYFKRPGFKGRIGLISPMSHRFCSECN
ncbi:MAG: radical SAM protein, partial [Clostridia bacterium]|nr:radical SAM protein [Clostridia bacterium]